MCNFLDCFPLPFADYRQDLKYIFFLFFEGTQNEQVKIAHQAVFLYFVNMNFNSRLQVYIRGSLAVSIIA